ncbi:MAG TPA: hypothetical protein VK327_00100 [Candidatus Paceibacterota bacterium]|nr:hypothetical protein [Candidatus Paceibacterota bacterium]
MRVLASSITVAAIIFAGCSVHESTRGNLSDAMEASASGGGGSRSDARDSSSSVGSEIIGSVLNGMVSSAADSGGASGMVDYESREFDWQIPIDAAYLRPLNGDIESIYRFTVTPVAVENKRNFFGVYLGGGGVGFKRDSLADRATDDAFALEIGLTYRRYLNDPHAFLSPYVVASAGWQPLFWHYRNAVVSGDETVTDDLLHGVTGYAGAGVAIWRRHALSLFGEAGFGGTVFVNTTGQGFHNDVFDDFGYFAVKAGLAVKF